MTASPGHPEGEALWQAHLGYWRQLPFWPDNDDEFEAGERDVFFGGEGRAAIAAFEAILTARVAEQEKALREQIAADIEAKTQHPEPTPTGCCDRALRNAARIARGDR